MLTPRQKQIAALVACGLSRKAIARTTGLSVHTVRNHIQNAAERIPGDSRPQIKLILFSLTQSDPAA